MVRTEVSLAAIGLTIVLITFDGLSLIHAANRQPASPAKQTAQRVMSFYAQAVTPPESLPLSLRESIALALERNFDILIEGYTPKIRAADVLNEQAEFDPTLFTGFLYSGGKDPIGVYRTASPDWNARESTIISRAYYLERNREHLPVCRTFR
jgi:hypothetical protein